MPPLDVRRKLIRRKPLKHDRLTPLLTRRRKRVTVCIAAIATEANSASGEDENVIIIGSDRGLTHGEITEYLLEDKTKTMWFTNKIVMLAAGDIDFLIDVFRDAYRRVSNSNELLVREVAGVVAAAYRRNRELHDEHTVLSRYMLDRETFIDKMQNLDRSVIQKILSELEEGETTIRATSIIAGLDREGDHIYLVASPGYSISRDGVGFAAIGIGAEHAETIFAEADYTENREWIEAVMLTYLAKKRAQAAPGVSEATDLYWIKSDGYRYIEPQASLLRRFEQIRLESQKRARIVLVKGLEKVAEEIKAVPPVE
jgi:hypothetical protein